MAVLGCEDRKYRIAWLECECCGEQSDPVALYDDESAVDVLPRPSKRECYRCADDGCECVTLLTVMGRVGEPAGFAPIPADYGRSLCEAGVCDCDE